MVARVPLLIAGSAAIGALLAGCSLLSTPDSTTAVARQTPKASPVPTIPSVFATEQLTTAVGTLTGAVTGTVEIRGSSRTGFSTTITTKRFTGSRERNIMLATSLRDIDCSFANDTERARQAGIGQTVLGTRTTTTLPPLEHSHGDLSYLTVLVLRDDTAKRWCDPSTMGVAHLHWTRSPALLDLHAVDTGPIPAAEGSVTKRAGKVVGYTVANLDELADVAQRLRLTPDEILYLNPRGHSETMLLRGDVLNLDPQNR